MKSAYELAMERLSKSSPTVKLTAAQKTELAELESVYASKIAERELATKDAIKKAESEGDFEKMGELEKELPFIRKNLQADLEAKKETVRQRKK